MAAEKYLTELGLKNSVMDRVMGPCRVACYYWPLQTVRK